MERESFKCNLATIFSKEKINQQISKIQTKLMHNFKAYAF